MLFRILFSLLLLASAAQAVADSDRHIVMLKGKAAGFEQSVEALGGQVVFRHGPTGIAVVAGLDEGAALTLSAERYVTTIAPDFDYALPEPAAGAVLDDPGALIDSPDDPTTAAAYARQWHMRAIEADAAWAAGRLGSPGVTVAILDTGIDYLYPDLLGRVDLVRSVSFLPDDDEYVEWFFPGAHPIADLYFHGTHVAATVASNAYIAAGVTSGTTLIGVKVCSVFGGCPFGAVISGILYATDAGADVANLSLGGDFPKSEFGRYVGFINKVLNYANGRGMTVVVSAGNEALDLDHDGNLYKTYCSAPNTICVAATGPTYSDDYRYGPFYEVDAPAPYSNYGRSAINVAAPGGTGYGYVWAGCSTFSLVIPQCQTGYYILGMTGTSAAAPHVSGLAALMVEDYGRRPGKIKTAIQQSADDLGPRGTDPWYGKGRINVYKAVQ